MTFFFFFSIHKCPYITFNWNFVFYLSTLPADPKTDQKSLLWQSGSHWCALHRQFHHISVSRIWKLVGGWVSWWRGNKDGEEVRLLRESILAGFWCQRKVRNRKIAWEEKKIREESSSCFRKRRRLYVCRMTGKKMQRGKEMKETRKRRSSLQWDSEGELREQWRGQPWTRNGIAFP